MLQPWTSISNTVKPLNWRWSRNSVTDYKYVMIKSFKIRKTKKGERDAQFDYFAKYTWNYINCNLSDYNLSWSECLNRLFYRFFKWHVKYYRTFEMFSSRLIITNWKNCRYSHLSKSLLKNLNKYEFESSLFGIIISSVILKI